jgi:hypothetical protein
MIRGWLIASWEFIFVCASDFLMFIDLVNYGLPPCLFFVKDDVVWREKLGTQHSRKSNTSEFHLSAKLRISSSIDLLNLTTNNDVRTQQSCACGATDTCYHLTEF